VQILVGNQVVHTLGSYFKGKFIKSVEAQKCQEVQRKANGDMVDALGEIEGIFDLFEDIFFFFSHHNRQF
jgi:hypothetical protein